MFDLKKEEEVLRFWRDNKIFEKSLELRKKAKSFVFFEGPPTANGLPHIGHFLTRIYKDVYGRYKTMNGYFVLRKAGWDTHGLPVEIEIEKELGFKNKKDIEAYGIDKFNKKAKESVWKYKSEWENMTRKMGFWLDMNEPYITYENNYIESLWAIIKKIWDRKLLYLAHRVVPFCVRCGTPLSSHEVAQGYKSVKENSVYIKFKLKQNEVFTQDTYILAWTTTPWTLPGNVALAVGKDIKYILAEKDGTKYVVAKDVADKVLGSGYKTEKEIKGEELLGLEYEPLFNVKELKSDPSAGKAGKSYKIYDADFVSTGDGTGVVHTAVMYGEDDYNLGTKLGLPKFHTVNEQGKFIHVGEGLDGLYVKDKTTEDLILQRLEAKNYLLKNELYEHDYPFCWRCNTPLLYYAKNSWFIKMSAINKELVGNNQKVNWIPEHIKDGRFGQWLKEGKDWAFSRERYWGTPLPIWECGDCGNFTTVGSLDDLEKNRYGIKNEFYVLRHGHSTKNGYGDVPSILNSLLEKDKYHLTPEGKKQAKEIAKKIKKMGGVDMIISSPFIRTKETAQIVAEELGIKVHTDDRIMEFQHGSVCEGKTNHVCGMKFEKGDWEIKLADGESWKDLKKRMASFLRDIDSKNEGKKILLVSHGDPIFLLECFTLGFLGRETFSLRDKMFPREGVLKKIDLKNWPYDDDGELDMHRPYIDKIVLKCKTCNGKMSKIPDLIDVWFDSGAMPYAQWHWPFSAKGGSAYGGEDMFKEQFPADFIVEAIDQTRGWFFTLLAISTLLEKGIPYKNVMVLGHTLDEKGVKMSKSKGNFVPVMEFMEKYGVDVLRWYFLSSMTMGESKSVIPREIEDKQKGFFGTLENCVRFYELYSENVAEWTHNTKAVNLLDKWILSKLEGLIKDVGDNLDRYCPTPSARAIEKFVVEDLSNWWLRRSRKRKESFGLLRFILLELSKMLAPFTPFVAEDIYKRMAKGKTIRAESVHLEDWSKSNQKLIDKALEKNMEEIRIIVASGLAVRKEKQIKVRQPLRAIILSRSNEFPKDLENLLKEELNVKNIIYDNSLPAQTGQKELVVLDTELDEELVKEGIAYEFIRKIQDMRKEAKFKIGEDASASISIESKLVLNAIEEHKKTIEDITSTQIFVGLQIQGEVKISQEFEIIPGIKISVAIKK